MFMFFIYVETILIRKILDVGQLPKDFLEQLVEESLFPELVTVGKIDGLKAGMKTRLLYMMISFRVLSKVTCLYIENCVCFTIV